MNVHVHSVYLNDRYNKQHYTYKYGVVAIGLGCPRYKELPISFLPNSRGKQETMTPGNKDIRQISANKIRT